MDKKKLWVIGGLFVVNCTNYWAVHMSGQCLFVNLHQKDKPSNFALSGASVLLARPILKARFGYIKILINLQYIF